MLLTIGQHMMETSLYIRVFIFPHCWGVITTPKPFQGWDGTNLQPLEMQSISMHLQLLENQATAGALSNVITLHLATILRKKNRAKPPVPEGHCDCALAVGRAQVLFLKSVRSGAHNAPKATTQ